MMCCGSAGLLTARFFQSAAAIQVSHHTPHAVEIAIVALVTTESAALLIDGRGFADVPPAHAAASQIRGPSLRRVGVKHREPC